MRLSNKSSFQYRTGVIRMINEAHAESTLEADVELLKRYFRGDFTGRMILTVRTIGYNGKRTRYTFCFLPGVSEEASYADGINMGVATSLEGRAIKEYGEQVVGRVGFDEITKRFVAQNEHGDNVWITPPLEELVDVSRLSSIGAA